MSYIGSNPITQFFQEGVDVRPVGATATSTFSLSRPVATPTSIEVLVGNAQLSPVAANYTVSGSTLTLTTAVSNTTVYVRYLTTSSYSVVPATGSVGINAISASGTADATTFLRGDGQWIGVGIPQNAKTAAYTAANTDIGKHIAITTGGVTVPKDVFSIGDVFSVFNNSTANQTITQGTGVTMYLAGTATTGDRTLAQYGMATLLCVATNTFVISGQGVS